MSVDQVRWRMNYLMKKYKECVDNNLKSGRGTMTFEYFKKMEEIVGQKKDATVTYTLSSGLPLQTSKNINIETEKERLKNQKTEKSNCALANTSKNINKEQNKCTELLRRTRSTKTKNEFETWFLEYMQKEEKRREERDVSILKTKKEALKLKQSYLQMREKELEMKKSLAGNKIKSKER